MRSMGTIPLSSHTLWNMINAHNGLSPGHCTEGRISNAKPPNIIRHLWSHTAYPGNSLKTGPRMSSHHLYHFTSPSTDPEKTLSDSLWSRWIGCTNEWRHGCWSWAWDSMPPPHLHLGGPGSVHLQNLTLSQVWWCPFVITELKRWEQENCGSETRLCCTVSSWSAWAK